VKALLVDLDTAWRGGQNQALLILKGLRSRGHEAELLAAEGSALGERAQESRVRVHFVSHSFLDFAPSGISDREEPRIACAL